MAYPYNGILHSTENDSAPTESNKIDGFHKNNVEKKKSDTKEYILYIPNYINFRNGIS